MADGREFIMEFKKGLELRNKQPPTWRIFKRRAWKKQVKDQVDRIVETGVAFMMDLFFSGGDPDA